MKQNKQKLFCYLNIQVSFYAFTNEKFAKIQY